MHAAAMAYAQAAVAGQMFLSVVEFGSRNVNGSARQMFPAADYFGIDIEAGPGVDLVADAADYDDPESADCVVCMEVLEHTPRWRDICFAAYRTLRPKGRFIVTCAGPGRAPHSAVDGGQVRPDEHYENVEPGHLRIALLNAGFDTVETAYNAEACDTYAVAWKG